MKLAHVNRIIRAFGGSDFVQETGLHKKRQTYNPTTLRVAAKNILLNEDYKIEHLHIALGTVLARQCKDHWYQRSTVNLKSLIPFADGKEDDEAGEYVELFCYPEKRQNNKLCYKTFHYTHILTNMRSHILTRGYEFCKKEDFEWIVDNMTGVLSHYLVEYNMDNQSAFSAIKFFGDKVILTLESNGHTDSVKFVKLVKAWHMACDERGIPADVRVCGLCNLHLFLVENLNFWSVPFQFPGRYICGMTWQTFEALLHCITTRIQLYAHALNYTYNAQSVSTLANESFFTDMVRLDKEAKGYPKACNVAQVMG